MLSIRLDIDILIHMPGLLQTIEYHLIKWFLGKLQTHYNNATIFPWSISWPPDWICDEQQKAGILVLIQSGVFCSINKYERTKKGPPVAGLEVHWSWRGTRLSWGNGWSRITQSDCFKKGVEMEKIQSTYKKFPSFTALCSQLCSQSLVYSRYSIDTC